MSELVDVENDEYTADDGYTKMTMQTIPMIPIDDEE